MPWRRSSTSEAMGLPKTDIVTLPPDPIQERADIRIGAGGVRSTPRDPGAVRQRRRDLADRQHDRRRSLPGFEQSFSEFPIPGTTARFWYLGPTGTLSEQPPTAQGVDSYTSNANATPLTDYSTNTGSGGLWGNASEWEWNWAQPATGSAVSYVSAPLTTDTTAIGGGAVHLWVESSTPDVDLQATVSEVRPDGNETFVQNGWLRAQRAQARHEPGQHAQTAAHAAAADSHLPRIRRASRCRRTATSRS